MSLFSRTRTIAAMALLNALTFSIPDAAAQPAPKDAGRIDVVIVNLRNTSGEVGCLLFSSAQGFPQSIDAAQVKQKKAISGVKERCRFDELPAGRYAISVMHDENGNGVLDTNLLGVPTEGYGASNNHTHAMTPPNWEESSFTLGAGEKKTLEIHLKY